MFKFVFIQNCKSISEKIKTPNEKSDKSLHHQSLLLNDTDITSDDEEHINSYHSFH